MRTPEADAQLRRLGELVEEISALNGLELGVSDPADVVRLFRMTDTMARYPTAMIRGGRIVEINHFFEEMLGYQRDKIVGSRAADFVTGELRHEVEERVIEDDPKQYETVVQRADGSRLRVRVCPERIGPYRFSSIVPIEEVSGG